MTKDLFKQNEDIYNFKNADDYQYKIKKGLSKQIVRDISSRKHEPQWLLDIRLKALETYNKLSLPVWGQILASLIWITYQPMFSQKLV